MLLELMRFRNPWLLVADKLGIQRVPYEIVSRTGARISVRPNTGDRFTVFETFGERVYERGLSCLRVGGTVIDVGANIGCFSIAAAKIVGSDGRIIAIEPEATTFRRLKENISINGISNIVPVNVAIADASEVKIFAPKSKTLFTSMYESVDGHTISGNVQLISAKKLAAVIEEFSIPRVDLLKLDCEGAEYAIIETLTTDIAQTISNIIIEFHNVSGHSRETAIKQLCSLGYKYRPERNHLFSRE